jgi:hypothetical protein
VLNERNGTPAANLDNSLFGQMLQFKRDYPLPPTGKLDDDLDLNVDRD